MLNPTIPVKDIQNKVFHSFFHNGMFFRSSFFAKGKKNKKATTQRIKANVKGGIEEAKLFPITKFPPHNKAAITNNIYGDFKFTFANPPVVKIFRTILVI